MFCDFFGIGVTFSIDVVGHFLLLKLCVGGSWCSSGQWGVLVFFGKLVEATKSLLEKMYDFVNLISLKLFNKPNTKIEATTWMRVWYLLKELYNFLQTIGSQIEGRVSLHNEIVYNKNQHECMRFLLSIFVTWVQKSFSTNLILKQRKPLGRGFHTF